MRARSRRPLAIVSLVAAAMLAACHASFPPGWAYVSGVTPTAATLVWTGPNGGRAECQAPGGAAAGGVAVASGRGLQTVRLDALAPSTRYACRIGPPTRRVRFRTAPAGDAPTTFAAVGDTGDGSRAARALARRILAGRPDFLVHLGDAAYPQSSVAMLGRRFFRPYERVLERLPLFPIPGNHDLSSKSAYGDLFSPIAGGSHATPYAFDWGPAHFVAVDSQDVARGIDLDWVARDLERAADRPWRILLVHEPPFTSVRKKVNPGLRERLEAVLAAGRVDVVLSGHSHLYERAEPICLPTSGTSVLQLTSGGGGSGRQLEAQPSPHPNFPRVVSVTQYLRVRVTSDVLAMRAVDVQGHVIDRARWRRGTARACRADGWPAPVAR